MSILDDLKQIQTLDKSNVLGSVQQLSLQLKQTQEDLKDLQIPEDYSRVNEIITNGMGGSRLGTRVVERLFEDQLDLPITHRGNYQLPKFLSPDTLAILSSYSGNTEEVLASIEQVMKSGAKILVFSQNGQLTQMAQENNWPGYYGFEPKHNPSNQPRMSIGYQILGIMLMLAKCGLVKIESQEIDQLISFTQTIKTKYNIDISQHENPAKQLAEKLHEKIPVLISSEFMVGATHVWCNQINENAKQLAVKYEIPELNHHLLEGMKFPSNNPENLHFVFMESPLYQSRNQKRYQVTQKVLEGYKIDYTSFKLTGQTQLEQVFELIQFGGYTGFYMSMLNTLDPSPIPWVDFFKKELKKET